MTYLAPRQGLFAIIILISFFIHTTLLLISTDQQLNALKMQTGERMLVQLIEEVKLPLLSKDKVSLSVLTGRYTSENDVASLTIKDIDGEIVLQTGQAQLLKGQVISQKVILSDNVIGEVLLTLRDTSNGEIIASQWLFVLGSFVAHLLMWLLYGYIARPTREQLAALSRDVQDHLISHQRINVVKRTRRTDKDNRLDADTLDSLEADSEDDTEGSVSSNFDINQAVNRYIQSHKSEDGNDFEDDNDLDDEIGGETTQKGRFRDHFNRSSKDLVGKRVLPKEKTSSLDNVKKGSIEDDSVRHDNLAQKDKDALQKTTTDSSADSHKSQWPLLANRPIGTAIVQIGFADPHNLIGTLAPEQAKPYFMLCTQLLDRTLTQLLKQPLLHGVTVSEVKGFNTSGAMVEFKAENSHSKAGLAAMMFAKVYMMLHEITCVKLRELGRFSADIYVGVSDEAVIEPMQTLLQHNGKAHEVYALLPAVGMKQLSGHMQLNSLPRPSTVYERDCVYLVGVNDAMMQRLVNVRNTVLLSGQ